MDDSYPLWVTDESIEREFGPGRVCGTCLFFEECPGGCGYGACEQYAGQRGGIAWVGEDDACPEWTEG